MYDNILIRYGEIGLKGKNQKDFLHRLVKNIKMRIKGIGNDETKVVLERGRVFVVINGQDPEIFYKALGTIFGILSFSPVRKVGLDLDEINKAALEEFKSLGEMPENFKVNARRSFKLFPLDSIELQREVGHYILVNTPGLKVDVHNPKAEVWVEVREEAAYVYSKKINGIGGLPIGTGGKAMLLLSGGIDSPVAGWMTMRRGLEIEAVYFHSHPYTSEKAKEKVLDLARVLAEYSGKIKVHIVPFTQIQEAISAKCFESLWITIMRRFMMRISERIAEQQGMLALATGESLGQVASQTVESMHAITGVINTPVIRPLVCMDKREIIDVSEKIGTYEISIRPFIDCCTVFLPKAPKTKPKREACEKAEKYLDIEALVQKAIDDTEVVIVKKG
ncbi:thiamine biosynthesis protein ThiI [Desulfonispora thiosulfatigenes DSM 11270]|uniref:Probable tRNA sulfurtransferase n=1 Tax=Desulfonispora thiosulfatigenes DSM 11270 TaxID=656914 RepID=A0A1W1V7B9_DESTI|nr:tRNA uracil 4-sulfurtransferase ThiI [Desulfonispora thiosulfatigenes]SMB89173.1 thiamine biosynthesis protein ThiI [Desulfonispora thiosulfatigenes DSM 11270]